MALKHSVIYKLPYQERKCNQKTVCKAFFSKEKNEEGKNKDNVFNWWLQKHGDIVSTYVSMM